MDALRPSHTRRVTAVPVVALLCFLMPIVASAQSQSNAVTYQDENRQQRAYYFIPRRLALPDLYSDKKIYVNWCGGSVNPCDGSQWLWESHYKIGYYGPYGDYFEQLAEFGTTVP